MSFKCCVCNGKGHTDRWSEKWASPRTKSQFAPYGERNKKRIFEPLFNIDSLKTKTCDYCIGTGIDLNRMATSILIKSGW